jgi:hypothetical protein
LLGYRRKFPSYAHWGEQWRRMPQGENLQIWHRTSPEKRGLWPSRSIVWCIVSRFASRNTVNVCKLKFFFEGIFESLFTPKGRDASDHVRGWAMLWSLTVRMHNLFSPSCDSILGVLSPGSLQVCLWLFFQGLG